MKNIVELITSYMYIAPPCLFHVVTGLHCPGCGGTRAVVLLFSGHPLLSLYYHPLVLYTLVGAVILLCLRLLKRKWNIRHFSAFLWGALIVLIVNCLIKNLALLCFHVDLLG